MDEVSDGFNAKGVVQMGDGLPLGYTTISRKLLFWTTWSLQ
jgi:hypothetical protein